MLTNREDTGTNNLSGFRIEEDRDYLRLIRIVMIERSYYQRLE